MYVDHLKDELGKARLKIKQMKHEVCRQQVMGNNTKADEIEAKLKQEEIAAAYLVHHLQMR